MLTHERRPAEEAATRAGWPTTSVLGIDEASVYLAGFDAGENVGRTIGGAEAWRAGYAAGFAEGRSTATEEFDQSIRDELTDANRALATRLTSRPDFATLCERRGEPEAAARQRRLLHARGVDQ